MRASVGSVIPASLMGHGFGKDDNRSHAIAYPVLTPLELLDLSLHGFREPEP